MLTMNKSDIPAHLLRFFKARHVFKPKDDAMIPHRVFDALMADGWYGRSDIVWHKNSPMPESVTDRPTRSHEYLFLLTKRPTYFYDATAIAEPSTYDGPPKPGRQAAITSYGGKDTMALGRGNPAGRNKRSVWTIPSAQFPDAHYATFPPDLIRPCILAGTSEAGECANCGKAWRRVVERDTNWQERKANGAWAGNVGVSATYQNGVHGNGMSHDLGGGPVRQLGWSPQCSCPPGTPTRRQVVLDPFAGSCTTWQVCVEEGRDFVGIDLDERASAWGAARVRKLPVGRLAGV